MSETTAAEGSDRTSRWGLSLNARWERGPMRGSEWDPRGGEVLLHSHLTDGAPLELDAPVHGRRHGKRADVVDDGVLVVLSDRSTALRPN